SFLGIIYRMASQAFTSHADRFSVSEGGLLCFNL
ncbi:hypothetical protein Csa_023659, partial [Cucumis sativus]